MAVLHSGNVATKQACPFFNVSLRKLFLLPERSYPTPNVHAKTPFGSRPLRGKRNRIITGSAGTARFRQRQTQTRRLKREFFFQWRDKSPPLAKCPQRFDSHVLRPRTR